MDSCNAPLGGSCELEVSYCDFTYGSWYIGIYGNSPIAPTTQIGYAIAAFIDARK